MLDKNIQLDQLEAIQKFADTFSQSKGDYLICQLNVSSNVLKASESRPVSFDGLMLVLVTRGSMRIGLNTEERLLGEKNVLVVGPNTQQHVLGVDESEGAEFYFLSVSSNFMKSINIDLNVLQNIHLKRVNSPILPLRDEYYKLIRNYLEMLYLNASINEEQNLYTKNISRSLIAALMYQLMQVADSHASEVDDAASGDDDVQKVGMRRFTYVKQFIELVHKHYSKERSVSFYADKLCISAKYLSFIIKEVTNRTAAEWIDEYVILEAKNMLRFSGMSVQQVAYSLNFSNQSAFGKYFKHLTGLSPTQFQKS